MLPQAVVCEECGKTAEVRSYGRLEYDFDGDNNSPTALKLQTVRLTIDCPQCGVRNQDHAPASGPYQRNFRRLPR